MAFQNTLYYGDNLYILREHIKDASVDLIYLDPPFNSKRSYNVLFKDESGEESPAQITAFEDSWHWNLTTEQAYQELVTQGSERVSSVMNALRQFIGPNQMMAYLVMMGVRLVELHRVLKSTGSLYLHCDPTASHYLKLLMDSIFGGANFRSEIIWSYRRWPTKTANYQHMHDVLLYYSKSDNMTFNVQYESASESFLRRFKGKANRLEPGATTKIATDHETPGMPLRDVWDISIIAGSSAERLGYPTQKPLALLERILAVSSNDGDVILDPFCGCGTTIAAAQKLRRSWIGIDVTHLAISIQKYRLKDMFGLVEKSDYLVRGEPEDLPSARQLAQEDRYQFQWWALSLVKARPVGEDTGREGKKGKDKGMDGIIAFIDEATGKAKRVLVQVKSGKVKSSDIRDLRGTIEREKAAMGLFITLESPTRDMITEANAAGLYHSPGWNRDYPRLQILTIADLLNGFEAKMPPSTITFKQAEKVSPPDVQQPSLL